jgi:crotonobetainyl-CoA:carnitine CoA-transferase CaiB-like acyl-CoA transferase
MLLGDMGAEVIKIEEPGHGDDMRLWAPFIDEWSTYFAGVNRSKKSIVIDLKSPAGAGVLRRLITRSDVLIENFRPGSLARLGFGYDDAHRLNPALIYCSISGYGQTGPRSDLAGYDPVIQAETGLMDVTGFADGPPTRIGIAITDFLAGLQGVQGILLALIHRNETGEGQHVDIALFDSLMSAMLMHAGAQQVSGENPRRTGNEHPSIAPYETLAAADGLVMVAVGNQRQWRQFCEALGILPLCDDPRFSTNADRVRNRLALKQALEQMLADCTVEHVIERLRREKVPCGRVRSVAEALEDPQIAARESFVAFPEIPGFQTFANPARLSRSPAVPSGPPPRLGQHTKEVLESLGYSIEEIRAIVKTNVEVA